MPRERSPDESEYPDAWWRSSYDRPSREKADDLAYPERIEVGTELFACSGSVDSHSFREATKFRALPDMTWEEARIALARLQAGRGITTSRAAVALAEFALPASGFTGFDRNSKRGDNAVKLRDSLVEARAMLRVFLCRRLAIAAQAAHDLARPVTRHGPDMTNEHQAQGIASTLSTKLPIGETWVRISKATSEQILDALKSLRGTITEWSAGREAAKGIAERLEMPDELPTADDYADAVYLADMLVWSGQTLLLLYAGMMIGMPVYRLYPTTPERKAVALWWPWGRPAPLFDGKPSPPPKPQKATLDPSIITATRPQDIVREVMQKTGINRTTAQRMTAPMRARMRQKRKQEAQHLLHQGLSKAEVARRVGLSPSRISAMFPGEEYSARNRKEGYEKPHRYDVLLR
jgi:hypothetical protein